jgi:biopolymer transport protein ExbD
MFFRKNQRKEIIVLNVVALIDICSILIIFLIMGTVFGESSVIVPDNLQVPLSSNKDTVTQAPQVTLQAGQVKLWLERVPPLSIEDFRREEGVAKALTLLRPEIEKYIQELPADLKKSGVLMNVLADRETSYKDIFEVVTVFRSLGIESILFVAQGD